MRVHHKFSSASSEAVDGNRPNGFIFVTPVWGDAYTQLFVDTALPCQLSAENIPGLSNLPGSTYLIVTTQKDAETIRAARSFQSLIGIIDTRIVTIEGEIVIPHETMSDCYRRGIALAEQRAAALVFLTPDCVVADGGFVALERLAMLGNRVVYVMGIRTLKQAVQFQLRQLSLPDGTIAAAPRVLARIALDSIHPMARSSLWEDDGYDLVPANLFWRVGTEGLVARCYHLHPLLVFPEQKNAIFHGTIDDDYVQSACPDTSKHYIVQDSDEVLIIELSDPERRFFTGLRKGVIEDVVVWAERFADARHRELIETTIRLHAGIGDALAWQKIELETDRIVTQVQQLLNRGILRLAFENPRALDGRLLRQGKERTTLLAAIESNDASGKRPEPGSSGRTAVSGGSIRNGETDRGRRTEAAPALVDLSIAVCCGFRWMSIALATAIDKSFRAYNRSVRFMARKVHVIGRLLFGAHDRSTLFSISGPYYRALKRDLDSALNELGPNIVSCANPSNAVGAIVDSRDDAPLQAVCVAVPKLVRLCNRQNGNFLPDGVATGLFVDLQSCHGNDLGLFVKEASRVLIETGRVAIKSDWLPNPSNHQTEQRMHLSQFALTEILRSDFDVVSQQRQGRIGTAIMGMLYVWARTMVMRLPLPAGVLVFVSFILIPLHLFVGLVAHIFTVVFDKLDKTDCFYVSSIVVAQKRSADSMAETSLGD